MLLNFVPACGFSRVVQLFVAPWVTTGVNGCGQPRVE
jgi:hypothetical protein